MSKQEEIQSSYALTTVDEPCVDDLVEVYINDLNGHSKKKLGSSEKSFLELDAMHVTTWLSELNKCQAIEQHIDDLLMQVCYLVYDYDN